MVTGGPATEFHIVPPFVDSSQSMMLPVWPASVSVPELSAPHTVAADVMDPPTENGSALTARFVVVSSGHVHFLTITWNKEFTETTGLMLVWPELPPTFEKEAPPFVETLQVVMVPS